MSLVSSLTYKSLPETVAGYAVDFLRPVLREAADSFPDVKFSQKEDKTLVSELDKTLEQAWTEAIHESFPGLDIVSEETAHVWPPTASEFIIIDPLDGTHNFLMGAPTFGSMAAFVRDGKVVFSIHATPHMVCYARRGGGAFAMKYDCAGNIRRWRRTHVSSEENLASSAILLEGSSSATTEVVSMLGGKIKRSRAGLSSVYAQALVAGGGLFPRGADALVAIGNKPWDNLPGCLLIEEAGGLVTDFNGNPYSLTNCSDLVFSNGKIHKQILKALLEVRRGPLP